MKRNITVDNLAEYCMFQEPYFEYSGHSYGVCCPDDKYYISDFTINDIGDIPYSGSELLNYVLHDGKTIREAINEISW